MTNSDLPNKYKSSRRRRTVVAGGNGWFKQQLHLDVFIESQYYSEERYGNRDIKRAQWAAHNMAYALATSDKNSNGISIALSGSANPGQSAKELDIRSIDNILRRQMIVYALIVIAGF